MPTLRLAEGRFAILCGNFEAALSSFLAGLELVRTCPEAAFPLKTAWCGMVAGQVEALVGLERYEDAIREAEAALEVCRKLEVGVPTHDISRALALAEARHGHFDRAAARLDEIIARAARAAVSPAFDSGRRSKRERVAISANDKRTSTPTLASRLASIATGKVRRWARATSS